MSSEEALSRDVTDVLGYLLKRAHLQLSAATTLALEPFGLDPRTLGVLRVLASRKSTSQQEVAQLLGVDRTSMVAFLDALEGRGIVSRRPLAHDRRRNVLELTESGRQVFEQASAAEREAEKAYIARLSVDDQRHLRQALRTIVTKS
ncbi:MAG: transcriptional regulator, MarR family [Subtercola sp.]|nr:transcriptional regulator, MarR family [Subtercola sp.]